MILQANIFAPGDRIVVRDMDNDPDIKKVAIVYDQKYAEKENDRSGGVGTETQIISREVYEQQQQDKFVAIGKLMAV